MRLDLFSKDDTVLLLGEGNFSFSVCLHKHNLPIEITATCFEKEPLYEKQKENVEFLKSKKVPVFFNVDSTKLHENTNIRDKRFSKVIFNFPHIGGKMKIHLNRQLLRESFKSCSHIIAQDGVMIVSLCQGQGGTPHDKPHRRWDDSWQVTEMAAHGDFMLSSIESFERKNFKDYQCIGYRSQDVKFNLNGALVHVFVKISPLYPNLDENVAVQRLNLVLLDKNISTPILYAELYKNNPLLDSESPSGFLKNLFIKKLTEDLTEVKILTDEDVPLYVKSKNGVQCVVDNRQYSLRSSAVQVIDLVLQKLQETDFKDKIFLFPGLYFQPVLNKDFTNTPVTLEFLIINKYFSGSILKNICTLFEIFGEKYLTYKLLKEKSPVSSEDKSTYLIKSVEELVFESQESLGRFTGAVIYSLYYNDLEIEACVVNFDLLCKFFLKLNNWKEIFVEKSKILLDKEGKPILKKSLLYPSIYKFDITLRFKTGEEYSEERMKEILWLAAGQMIEKVEFLNYYNSGKGWSSKCYRITYKCLHKPLYKEKANEIHCKLVGRMLELGLKVVIS